MSAILSAVIQGEDKFSAVLEGAAQNVETYGDAIESVGSTATGTARALDDAASAGQNQADTMQRSSDSIADSVDVIKNALVAAGLAKLVNQVTDAVIEMANEHSRAEAIIIKSTGATGAALDGLSNSMLNVFATARNGDLSLVASALSEVNTRLNLQGDELERTTRLHLDFADVTGADVTSSIKTVSMLMSRWNIEVTETERVLDKFTLAGQLSGIAVDQLTYKLLGNQATLDALNFSMDESVALFARLEQKGIDYGAAMYGLRRSLIYAGQEGRDAREALSETIEEIYNMESASEATARAVEVFGVRAGPELAFAIQSGAMVFDDWVEKIASADGTLSATAEAATTLEERWAMATNSISAAFTGVLAPAVTVASEGLADIVQWIGDFLNENPAVAAAIATIGTGLVAATSAVMVYTAAKAVATTVTAVFGATAKVALGPVFLIAGAIAAVVAGAVLLGNALSDANSEFNSLTMTSRQSYNEITRLNDEYRRAVEIHGELSPEAERLRGELEASRLVFEASRVTLEEFYATVDRLIDNHREMADTLYSTMDALDAEERSAGALISRLEVLSDVTDITAAQQQQMALITGELVAQFPEMAEHIDEATGSLVLCAAAMRDLAAAQVERERTAAAHEAFIEALRQEEYLYAKLQLAAEQYTLAAQRRDDMVGRFSFNHSRYRREVDEAREVYEALSAALYENQHIQATTEAMWESQAEALARAEAEAVQLGITYEEGVGRAIESVVECLLELSEAFDVAFDSAQRSLKGTFGLFEMAEERAGIASQNIIEAWESQIKFFEAYNDNLQALQDFDINTDFLTKLSDGSQDSMAQVASLVNELEGLDPEEAAAKIAEINSTFENLTEARDTTAQTMAEISTDFDNRMDEILDNLGIAIDDMDMSNEAGAAAQATIDAYIANIRAGIAGARDAAESVANAVAGALGGRTDVGGYATGTRSAPPGLAWVGEEGPELMAFSGGERVYPANESHRMAAAENGRAPINITPPPSMSNAPQDSRGTARQSQDRAVKLDINCNGKIEAPGVDKESIWDTVAPRLKEAFMGIIQEEVFEEGEEAYAF